jgi:hypothetical protein
MFSNLQQVKTGHHSRFYGKNKHSSFGSWACLRSDVIEGNRSKTYFVEPRIGTDGTHMPFK